MTGPPLERWSEDEALRELARLARDLPVVDADEAWRRLMLWRSDALPL